MRCAQAEDGLLSSLQLPLYVVKVQLLAVAVAGPVGLELAVEQRLDFLVTYRIVCLHQSTVSFGKSIGLFISRNANMGRHPLECHCNQRCQSGKGGVQALDQLVWINSQGLAEWTWNQ